MAQEPYKDDNKPRLPKFNNRPNGDGDNLHAKAHDSAYTGYMLSFSQY